MIRHLSFIILLCFTAAFAQSASPGSFNSEESVIQDSIKIADLVQQQIETARLKASIVPATVAAVSGETEVLSVPVKKAEIKRPDNNGLLQLIYNLSFEVKTFISFSIGILMWVFFRRIKLRVKFSGNSALKQKIKMLREESVPQKYSKSKKRYLKILPNNFSGTNLDEKVIARKARELNITQGELLLAARLKNFELGNMQAR